MFVRYYVDVPLPFEQVERALLDDPERWVPGIAEGAQARAETLMAEVGFGPNGRRVGKKVIIDFGQTMRFPSRTIVPLSWRASGPEGLFPVLDADLEVAALGPNRTQLSMNARYRPPLGVLGKVVD
ncbi:MAG TPA: hypothetical protein VEM93_09395, partial [Actinomycetota bacterium]|nr:hypothetical protein [Actinomycetota bacterium]